MPFAAGGDAPVDYDREEGFNIFVQWDPDAELYGMVLETSNDRSAKLSQEQALEWVRTMLAALAAAEHDRAVAIQQARLGTSMQDIAALLHELREARGPLEMGLLGIRLEPIIATRPQHRLEAVVTIYQDGKPSGQWGREEILDHANGILMCGPATKEDNAYYSWLTKRADLDHGVATHVIADLIDMHDPKLVFRPTSGPSAAAGPPSGPES